MKRIYIQTSGVESWRQKLAEPERHWRTGYSARSLACDWEEADGLPEEVSALLAAAFDTRPELIAAFPEHEVALPGGRRNSQNDVLALVGIGPESLVMAVEGKVAEPFGPTIGEWLPAGDDLAGGGRSGKRVRFDFIAGLLGLPGAVEPTLRYQLFHRTASAVMEARRFRADRAAMVVHSYSPAALWFDDFARFASLFGLSAKPGVLASAALPDGLPLHLGWVSGNPAMLMR